MAGLRQDELFGILFIELLRDVGAGGIGPLTRPGLKTFIYIYIAN